LGHLPCAETNVKHLSRLRWRLGFVCILAVAVSLAFFDDNGGSGVGWTGSASPVHNSTIIPTRFFSFKYSTALRLLQYQQNGRRNHRLDLLLM
jgi:hypothetical protein